METEPTHNYTNVATTILVDAYQSDSNLITHEPDSVETESRYAQSTSILSTLSQKETKKRTLAELRALLPNNASSDIKAVVNHLEELAFIKKSNKDGGEAAYTITKEGWETLLRIQCDLVLEALGDRKLDVPEIKNFLKPHTIPDVDLFITKLEHADFIIEAKNKKRLKLPKYEKKLNGNPDFSKLLRSYREKQVAITESPGRRLAIMNESAI